jgi:hypothetical protein
MQIWIQIQGFDDQKSKNSQLKKLIFFFFFKNCTLLNTGYLSEPEIYLIFPIFVGNFCPLGFGSGSAFPMRIRIQPTIINADPKHRL